MGPELRVFVLDRCVINPVPAAAREAARSPLVLGLAAIFVPRLIESALGSVATALKAAGEDKTMHVSGSAFTDFFAADANQALQVNRAIACVLAVYGTFDGDVISDGDDDDYARAALLEHGYITKNSDVEIIFEAEVRPSSDRTAFFLDTRHFSVRGLVGDKDSGERGFVVTLSVATASASAVGDTIAIGNIDFGVLEQGADLVPRGRAADGHPQFRSNLMPWGQISTASKAAYDADVAGGAAAGKRYMPSTFGVTITQTEKGHPFLAKLGKFFDDTKHDTAAAISKAILPEERAKAEADRSEAAETLYTNELDAELKLREARKAYDAGANEDKATLRVKLEMATRKRDRAVQLRKAAGLPDRAPIPAS